MIFALLTLLTALSLAAVAGWFSIVGFMAIYAGAPMAALIMGAVTECAKLVTISWIYRNWEYANWRLKGPLIYFTIALMVATSIGVFGFLSKGHLEQGAGTIDNSARIETLNYQINREKSLIADNEKVIGQLDATVNSFLGKDRTDRSLAVRKSQAPQRKQLREDSDAAQKRIDALSADKFKLESEVRKMQLDVGPIRYIAELFYGVEENATKNIEAAVRIFTLLIVSTLDPLAVILLVAANHTLLRLRDEKEKTISPPGSDRSGVVADDVISPTREEISEKVNKDAQAFINNDAIQAGAYVPTSIAETEEDTVHVPVLPETVGLLNEEKGTTAEKVDKIKDTLQGSDSIISPSQDSIYEDPLDIIREVLKDTAATSADIHKEETVPEVSHEEIKAALEKISSNRRSTLPAAIVRQPTPTQVVSRTEYSPGIESIPEEPPIPTVVSFDDSIVRELRGNTPHFVPQKVNEEEKPRETETKTMEENTAASAVRQEIATRPPQNDKYPKALSWLAEFKRS
jgi:hypothetical protein